MIRRPPRATRTDTLFPLHDALPISGRQLACGAGHLGDHGAGLLAAAERVGGGGEAQLRLVPGSVENLLARVVNNRLAPGLHAAAVLEAGQYRQFMGREAEDLIIRGQPRLHPAKRSERRSVGEKSVRTCRTPWAPIY